MDQINADNLTSIVISHERKIARHDVEISALQQIKSDVRLARIDKIFFAAACIGSVVLWLIANKIIFSDLFGS